LKKPAASFPARARDENCDAELMPVICPTAQEYFLRFSLRRSQSNPCTGGAVFPVATVSGILTDGGGLTLAAACCSVAGAVVAGAV
jgi:hypothetical protein